MDERETRALMQDVASVMKSLIGSTLAPIMARLDALEQRAPAVVEADPEKVAMVAVQKLSPILDQGTAAMDAVRAGLAEAVAGIGKDMAPVLERLAAVERKLAEPAVAPADMASVKEEVAALRKGLADLPKPAELPDIPKMVADAVATIPPVEPVDMVAIGEMIDAAAAFQVGKQASAAYADAMKAAEAAAEKLAAAEEQARQVREASLASFSDLTASVANVSRRCEDVEQAIEPAVKTIVADAIAALPAPMGFDPDVLPPLVAAEVEKAVSGLPKPQDGHSPTAAELDALIEPRVSKAVAGAVAAIPVPKDGCGIKELLIDRDGALVATMDDGRLRNLGPVVGKDGLNVDMASVERRMSEAIASLPTPKDGLDGLGFDDMTVTNEGRSFTLRFEKGDRVKEFTFALPVMIHRGIWSERAFEVGDVVTWGGSMWHCDVDGATAKPGEGEKQWHLVVKKGRDLRLDEPKQIPVVKLKRDD